MKYLKFLSPSDDHIQIRLSFGHFCNQKCIYCYNKVNYGKKFLDRSDIDIFLEKIHQSNLSNILIHLLGGEPTVNPNLKYFEERCNKDSSISEVRVYTNFKKHVDFSSQKFTLNPSFHYKVDFNKFLAECIYHRERIARISLMDFAQKDRIPRLLKELEKYPDLKEKCEICPVFFKDKETVHYIRPDESKDFEYFDGKNKRVISQKDIYEEQLSFKGWECHSTTFDIGCDLKVQTSCFSLGDLRDLDFRFLQNRNFCPFKYCKELYKLQIYKTKE